jgi:putative inorganic carbon (hco3(-)) transporter
MRFKPGAFEDQEDIFPGRKNFGPGTDVPEQVWNVSGKSRSLDAEVIRSAASTGNSISTWTPPFGERRGWIQRRGHTATFIALFIFSVVLYARPYETIPALSSFTSMAFFTGVATLIIFAFTQFSIEGTLTARPREINLVLLFGVAALLSMPMAEAPGEAWQTFTDYLVKMIVMFVVIVNVVRTESRLKLLLWLVIAVSIYLSINAIYDYQQGFFQTGAVETHDLRIAGRIKGLFENSNDLAMHLVTMIPIAIALGLGKGGLFRKAFFWGATALMVGAVVVSFSRGGFIGLIAAVFVLARRFGKRSKGTTTAALVLGGILMVALAPGAYSSRLATIFNSSADVTASSSQRTEVLKRSVWVALRYPLFGVGIGNSPHKMPRNLGTHNAYTQVASEMGMAALVVYIMFMVYPFKRLRLIENESDLQPERKRFYYLAIGLQASLAGYMVSSFFGSVAYQWYVYYLVGYAVCLHRLFIMEFQPEKGLTPEFWQSPFSKKREPLVTTGEPASQTGSA